MRIGLDLLGSDALPQALYPAALELIKETPSDHFFVIFITKEIAEAIGPPLSPRIIFHLVEEYIAMTDDPIKALKKQRKSSTALGIEMLKRKELDVWISAGNTGALIAEAALTLSPLPLIKRPALLTTLPSSKGPLIFLDAGGSIHCRAQHFVQFSRVGGAHLSCLQKSPIKIGLLNVGIEPEKGTAELRQAHALLTQLSLQPSFPFEFIGNIEGRDIFKGLADVIITDGATGNILLKSFEGISSFIFDELRAHSSKSEQDMLLEIEKKFDFPEYPGALVAGVEGIVLKCHGEASARSLYNAALGAIALYRSQHIQKMKAALLQMSLATGLE